MGRTHKIAVKRILIKNFQIYIVADVFYVEFELLIPIRGFTLIRSFFGSETLLSQIDHNVRIHLAEQFGVTCDLCFDNVKYKFSGGR